MKKVEYKNILIVEDNEKLKQDLYKHFSLCNNVTAKSTLSDAVEALLSNTYDIVLLDLILPDGSGLKLFEYTSGTPVVILSDLGSDSNMLDGFNSGAVDYIVKPASLKLIETRMALRLLPDSEAHISSHGLELNKTKRTATYNGTVLDLTSSEFNILMFLMCNSGEFFTAVQIYESIWKMPYMNSATIKTHLSNLRKKMFNISEECAELIISQFGKGYAFTGNSNE